MTSVQYTGADNGDTVGVTYAFRAAKVKQQYWEQTTAVLLAGERNRSGPERAHFSTF